MIRIMHATEEKFRNIIEDFGRLQLDGTDSTQVTVVFSAEEDTNVRFVLEGLEVC